MSRPGVRPPRLLRRSLRARLVGYFLLLSVLTVLVVGLVVNVRATDELRAAILDRVSAAAGLKTDAVQRWLEEQRRTAVFLAGLLGDAAGTTDRDDLRLLLLEEGTEADRAAARTSVDATLGFIVESAADAAELLLLDPDGVVRVSTVPTHEGRTQAGEPYFIPGSSQTWVEGTFISSLTGEPTIVVATPLFAGDGERVGVLATILDLARLDRMLLGQTGLGATGTTILVDAERQFVSGAEDGTGGGGLRSTGIDEALAGSDGQGLYMNHRGIEVIGAWRWVPEMRSALVAEITQAEAFAPARNLAGLIALVGLASAILLALGISVITRRITQPILGLARTAERVAGGDLEATAPVQSEDEVGNLARAFNAMTGQLRENVATLERRVEERTAELQQRNSELAIMNDVGLALAAKLDFAEVIEAVGQRVAAALETQGLTVAIRHEQTDAITFLYWIDHGVRRHELEGTVLDDEVSRQIVATGRPMRFSSAQEAAERGMPFKVGGTESYLGVPIPVGDRTIGVMALGTDEVGAYGEDEERLLVTLATNMGVAIDNARLFAGLSAALEAKGEAEAKYRRLVEELPLALYIDRPDERAASLYVSPMIVPMFGYPAEAWVSDNFFPTILHPEDRERVLQDHVDVFARGDERWSWEFRVVAADGRSVWVHDEAVVVKDDDGTPLYVQGFMQDVTEERLAAAELTAAHAALGEAEARYRQLVEELPLAVYIDRPDATSTSTYISPPVEAMFGYPVDAWLNDDFFASIVHPDDRERVAEEARGDLEGSRGRYSSEYRLIAADGRTVWVRDDSWVVRNPDGTPAHILGFMMDVTEERTAEAEVRRQKQYFESLVEASPVAIVVMDRDEVVTAWNPAAERLFGYRPDEAVGKHIDDLIFSADRRAEGAEATREAGDTGRSQRIGQRMRSDGSLVDVEIVVVPLMLDGDHAGYYAIYHDIAELVEARRQADAANEAKSAFLAAMSHEIRTPMNAIIGMSGLLVDTSLADDQREYAETIRASSEALLTIINDILDFSKIEAGRVELEAEPFAPYRVIEGALDVLAPSAAARGVELAYEAADDLPPALVGDAGRLRQILLNLLSNAVKFTDHGEVVLRVDSAVLPDGRYEVTITVRDTGIGIPPDRMDRLFQSFSQVDASVSRRYGGTGLGLAISRRLAELMDGSLTAESTGVPGEGSTFALRFRAAAAPGGVAEAATRVPGVVAGKRALVVDDNATNRRILELQAKRWGMEVRSTEHPAEAIGWVRDGEAFDVALLDFNMPEMNGDALAAALRQLRPQAAIPAMILSSVGPMDRTDPAVVATLTKPVKPSALHDALAEAFGAPSARAGPSGPSEAGERLADAHPLRILLVEDNAMNRRLATILLERIGYTADVATNGLEAIEALERATYDVALMDIQMPELDGLEATRRIRARWADGARPRIVALTANAMAEDRAATVEAGMDDYLSKPIRPDELIEALRRTERRTDA